MGRSPCCTKVGLRRGPWSTKEDSLLVNFIRTNGEGQWRSLPKKAGLLRCGKSCRLRWMNYLRPGIKRGNISQDEEDLIVRLHGLLGNRWSLIAGRLPGRTDNDIKNYWNTHILKKLKTAGVDLINPPKPAPKTNKSAAPALATKKKTKPKKSAAKIDINDTDENPAAAAPLPKKEELKNSNKEVVVDDPPKTKVYLPKPIRVSPEFSRTNSYDSLASGGSTSDAIDVAEFFPVAAWPPIFEMEDADCVRGLGADDFLGGGFILPVLDVHTLEEVYDEYLQLL